MMRSPISWITILAMQATILAPEIHGGDPSARTGFLTDRLTPKQVRVWKEMERLSLATRADGDPIHPVLYELYRWAQTSGLGIHVEMHPRESKLSHVAGRCVPIRPAGGETVTARIFMFVEVIDRACTERVIPGDDYIPFVGLTGHERYIETLAHELTHLRLIATSPSYSVMFDSMETEVQQLLVLARRRISEQALAPELSDLQHRVRRLTEQVEGPAVEVEKMVHSELVAGRQLLAGIAKAR